MVLDKFVKPDKPVINYKTEITGVTAEDLEKATLSVTNIQKKIAEVSFCGNYFGRAWFA